MEGKDCHRMHLAMLENVLLIIIQIAMHCRMVWMVVITEMRELAEAMDAEGEPQPQAVYKRPNGQWVADVFPLG